MRFVLFAAVLVLSGCASRQVVYWRPHVVPQVPDSTPVRYRVDSNTPFVRGVAVDWTRNTPRIVTARGDTVVVPPGVRLDVRLREKSGKATMGAVIGFVAGVIASYAACPEPRTHCGEEDPTPLLGAGVGALVGSLYKSYPWVRVCWDTP
jgi:hypothetical protein